MTTSSPTPPDLSDTDLADIAIDFLDDMLSAADVDTIGAANWWDRAMTALETAAASSDSWSQCVSRAMRKLQIQSADDRLSRTVARLANILGDRDVYYRWAQIASRDARYITALVRERRAARRPAKKTTEPKPKPAATKETECLPF